MEKKKILILNGPNLNLLGTREPGVYGDIPFDTFLEELRGRHPGAIIEYYQSNHEGALIDKIHEAGFSRDGIVLNAGGYTHTSVALADAVSAVPAPVIEVHVSNTARRETFRHRSFLTAACRGVIAGLGLASYELAVIAIENEW
ncbi:MAG: 3-dehydroquinate dehydratase [Odoribacteraceae bacterium]|jgi:3-dehydroquinate dehydratase-2|nr:3-dehydroquinate dehydratase [Odoribacteraceae bacterium]